MQTTPNTTQTKPPEETGLPSTFRVEYTNIGLLGVNTLYNPIAKGAAMEGGNRRAIPIILGYKPQGTPAQYVFIRSKHLTTRDTIIPDWATLNTSTLPYAVVSYSYGNSESNQNRYYGLVMPYYQWKYDPTLSGRTDLGGFADYYLQPIVEQIRINKRKPKTGPVKIGQKFGFELLAAITDPIEQLFAKELIYTDLKINNFVPDLVSTIATSEETKSSVVRDHTVHLIDYDGIFNIHTTHSLTESEWPLPLEILSPEAFQNQLDLFSKKISREDAEKRLIYLLGLTLASAFFKHNNLPETPTSSVSIWQRMVFAWKSFGIIYGASLPHDKDVFFKAYNRSQLGFSAFRPINADTSRCQGLEEARRAVSSILECMLDPNPARRPTFRQLKQIVQHELQTSSPQTSGVEETKDSESSRAPTLTLRVPEAYRASGTSTPIDLQQFKEQRAAQEAIVQHHLSQKANLKLSIGNSLTATGITLGLSAAVITKLGYSIGTLALVGAPAWPISVALGAVAVLLIATGMGLGILASQQGAQTTPAAQTHHASKPQKNTRPEESVCPA